MKRLLSLVALASFACAPATAPPPDAPAPDAPAAQPAFASTYTPFASGPTLIRGGTVMTAAGEIIENGDVLLRDGRIAAVGRGLDAAGATVIDASGRFVTPGIIDTHSHLGVFASPGDHMHSDGNEATHPNTAHVWAEHSVWPQDPGLPRALAGGVTSLHVLPGSANLFGGRGVTLRNVPARTAQEMKFPGAPHSLKMACGENPKRVYGSRGREPSTRMGNNAQVRAAWIRAAEYRDRWDRWERNGADPGSQPTRDLNLETLAGVLRGDILVQNHCYRADEIANRLDIAREFGYSIRSIHHGIEAYKVADMLAEAGVGVSIWADWWGFKLEALDATNANAALTHQAGVTTVIHSDHAIGIQHLNQEVAKALAAGREAGIDISDDDALRWITANAAWTLGIEEETGSLEEGKRADVVVWSAHPFSVYASADQVLIDGALVYDRHDPTRDPVTDFELGIFSGGID